jgi:hypothetical protein
MPSFVEGPMIGPESLAAGGSVVTSPAGAKEIHFDSAAIRAQYESSAAMAPAPGFEPPIAEGAPAEAEQPLTAEVMKALMSGNPPPAKAMPVASTLPSSPIGTFRAPILPPPPAGAIELRVPVGGGITATVTFSAQPKAKHWKRLLAHIEIEADPDNEFEEETPTNGKTETEVPHPTTSRRGTGRKAKGNHLRVGDDEG